MPFPVIGAAIAGTATVLARFLVPYIITRTVVALGLTLLTFTGADLLGDYVVQQVRSGIGGMAGDMTAILALAGIFDAMEVLLAAYVASIQIRAIRGSFKSLSFGASA